MDVREFNDEVAKILNRDRAKRFAHYQTDLIAHYKVLNSVAKKGKTLFTGSSLMEQFPIHELLQNNGRSDIIYNRGVGGFTTTDMLNHMEEQIFELSPKKIFINIGTNDIGASDYRLENLIENYRRILSQIKERLPKAKVYLMAYYPMNELASGDGASESRFGNRTNANLEQANAAVKRLADEFSYRFIDVNNGLTDETGRLKREYTVEGVHMYANAYQVVLQNMIPYLDEE